MKFKTWLYLAGGVLWGLIPLIAEAALVPCGISTGQVDSSGIDPGAISCNLCSVGELIQNVINFMVGISIPISVVMFGWAGVLMFTSGTNPSQVEKGKKIFQSVFMGFVLVITGWLIVQTILGVVVEDSFNFTTYWNGLDCAQYDAERFETTHGNIGQYINGIFGYTQPLQPMPITPTGTYTCPTGFVRHGTSCDGPNGSVPATQTTVGGGTISQKDLEERVAAAEKYATEMQEACDTYHYTHCSLLKAITAIEAPGRPAAISPKGCVGLGQVCPLTACGLDKSLQCSPNDILSSAKKQEIIQKLQQPQYNLGLTVQYLQQLESQFGFNNNMIAAYNGGPKANRPSQSCPRQTWWQCSANPRYQETRNYVPNVLNAQKLIIQ